MLDYCQAAKVKREELLVCLLFWAVSVFVILYSASFFLLLSSCYFFPLVLFVDLRNLPLWLKLKLEEFIFLDVQCQYWQYVALFRKIFF